MIENTYNKQMIRINQSKRIQVNFNEFMYTLVAILFIIFFHRVLWNDMQPMHDLAIPYIAAYFKAALVLFLSRFLQNTRTVIS